MTALRYSLVAMLALAACAVAAIAQPYFPALSGRVVDEANLLSAAQEKDITAKLEALENKTTDQLVVVTVPSLQDLTIEEFGYQLGRHWQIGQKDKNNGVILIIAPNERRARIEVGYGLEGDITDALARVILETSILPKFRSGDMPGGIVAGVDDIISVLTGDAETVQQRVASRPDNPDDLFTVIFTIMVIIIIIIIIVTILRSGASGGGSSGGGWSSGSSGGSWGGSSGGFSGGGGSFGGGGSSGGW